MADLTSLTDAELEARWNRLNAEAGPIWKSTDPGHMQRMANLRRGGEAVRAEQRRRREAPIIAGANDPIAQGAMYLRDPRRPDTPVGNRSADADGAARSRRCGRSRRGTTSPRPPATGSSP